MISGSVRLGRGEQRAGHLWAAMAPRIDLQVLFMTSTVDVSEQVLARFCNGIGEERLPIPNKVKHPLYSPAYAIVRGRQGFIDFHWFWRHFWPGNQ